MSEIYVWIKWIHVISSAVLFGTGAGIAFFFVRAQCTHDARIISAVAQDVVLADLLFTATAVVIQPITGVAMALLSGYPLRSSWIELSLGLYVLIGCCWLPVVWLQIQMRRLALKALATDSPLPPEYSRYYRWWFALGWPAFLGVLTNLLLDDCKAKGLVMTPARSHDVLLTAHS